MWKFEWSDAMSVAVDELDEDHKRAVRFLNLIGISAASGDLGGIKRLASSLTADLSDHFRREERVLKKHGFPRLAKHAAGHAEALRQLQEFEGIVTRGNVLEILHWCDKLRLFFVERLIMDDIDYKWFFIDNGIVPEFEETAPSAGHSDARAT